jgi:hypothetical protein
MRDLMELSPPLPVAVDDLGEMRQEVKDAK